MNKALFLREMKKSAKLLLLFAAVITLYVSCIIYLYDPETTEMLNRFVEVMPELMAAVGMGTIAGDLLEFMVSYLYGFILLIFPMLFCILRANGLIAKYVDGGAMLWLTAAPVKRRKIAFTQMTVLVCGILLLLIYTTALEFFIASLLFPGELMLRELLLVNLGLLAMHFFLGGICFFASCTFSDTRLSLAVGAGLPTLMFVFQMIANVGGNLRWIRFLSAFTLFDPTGLIAGETGAAMGLIGLLLGGLLLYPAGIAVFCKKDLAI